MPVTSRLEDKQTEKTAAELPENEENLKGLMFQWAPNLLIGLRNHCYVQQKEDQLFVTKKNDEWIEIKNKNANKNAKMVSKSSKHGKTMKPF